MTKLHLSNRNHEYTSFELHLRIIMYISCQITLNKSYSITSLSLSVFDRMLIQSRISLPEKHMLQNTCAYYGYCT